MDYVTLDTTKITHRITDLASLLSWKNMHLFSLNFSYSTSHYGTACDILYIGDLSLVYTYHPRHRFCERHL